MSAHASPPTAAYGVVVPVKRLARAKSRLAPLGDDLRRDLVQAFVADTVAAVLACPLVSGALVVTDEAQLSRGLADLGVAAIPDGAEDLNASLVQAAAELLRRLPGARPVALCADLPAVRQAELATVLREGAGHDQAFLADVVGTGTTLYTATGLDEFRPRFGAGSREAHLAAGAHELDGAVARSVQLDVDTPDDLQAALALGVGARTRLVALRAGLGPRSV